MSAAKTPSDRQRVDVCVVTWNTAERSRISWAVDVSTGAFTGTVTQGKFAGEPVTGTFTLTPLQGNCFTPVTKAEADGTVSL